MNPQKWHILLKSIQIIETIMRTYQDWGVGYADSQIDTDYKGF